MKHNAIPGRSSAAPMDARPKLANDTVARVRGAQFSDAEPDRWFDRPRHGRRTAMKMVLVFSAIITLAALWNWFHTPVCS